MQKTAYEMRISDWTSDVFSSDLAFPSSSFGIETATSQMLTAFCLVLMVTPPLPARYAATASGVLLMLSLLWTYLHFMAYVTIWGADLPDEIAWVQIGRASCRERVCQYV